MQLAIDNVVERFGGIYGLVNCAGVGDASRVATAEGAFPLELFEKVIRINLIGTFNVLRLVAEAMLQNEPNESGETIRLDGAIRMAPR